VGAKCGSRTPCRCVGAYPATSFSACSKGLNPRRDAADTLFAYSRFGYSAKSLAISRKPARPPLSRREPSPAFHHLGGTRLARVLGGVSQESYDPFCLGRETHEASLRGPCDIGKDRGRFDSYHCGLGPVTKSTPALRVFGEPRSAVEQPIGSEFWFCLLAGRRIYLPFVVLVPQAVS